MANISGCLHPMLKPSKARTEVRQQLDNTFPMVHLTAMEIPLMDFFTENSFPSISHSILNCFWIASVMSKAMLQGKKKSGIEIEKVSKNGLLTIQCIVC